MGNVETLQFNFFFQGPVAGRRHPQVLRQVRWAQAEGKVLPVQEVVLHTKKSN